MGEIVLKNLTKKFGDVTAIAGVSLEIEDGKITSFLGPSGCGKTTTLRLVAGLEDPTEGEIFIDGELVSTSGWIKPPEDRNLGMVFQNYAVWPHMTVFQNVAYPLKLRHQSKGTIEEKVNRTLELVGMGGLNDRLPEQLSGGQQQRVALARALVMEPTAMLLDEPLSNLDAKLRERMRFEIMELHRKLGVTVVYVTHDQSEAMVISHLIVLMQNQQIAQVGTAEEIYRKPVNQFVADFVGIANFVDCTVSSVNRAKGSVTVSLDLSGEAIQLQCLIPENDEDVSSGSSGSFFVRPEDIALRSPEADKELKGIVKLRTFLGDVIDYRIEAGGVEWRAKTNPEVEFEEGEKVGLAINRALFLPH